MVWAGARLAVTLLTVIPLPAPRDAAGAPLAAPTRREAAWAMSLAPVVGLVLGAAAALGREFLDRAVYDTRALQNEFEVPVLGEIPRITAA